MLPCGHCPVLHKGHLLSKRMAGFTRSQCHHLCTSSRQAVTGALQKSAERLPQQHAPRAKKSASRHVQVASVSSCPPRILEAAPIGREVLWQSAAPYRFETAAVASTKSERRRRRFLRKLLVLLVLSALWAGQRGGNRSSCPYCLLVFLFFFSSLLDNAGAIGRGGGHGSVCSGIGGGYGEH